MNLGKILNLDSKPPFCPLCDKRMVRKYEELRHVFIFVCHTDRIAIACDDPFVGRWDQAHAAAGAIECPNCNAAMSYFATATGFMKAKCRKKGCGATVSNSEPDRAQLRISDPNNLGMLQ